jgi:hypothetical protein
VPRKGERTRLLAAVGDGPPPVVVGQSEVADFRQCPLKHKLRWREGWYLPADHPELSESSDTGTQWHAIIARHYQLIKEFQQAGKEIDGEHIGREVGKFLVAYADAVGMTDERFALLQWMYEGYVERWGFDRDWEIVNIEQTLVTPIFNPETGERTRFMLRWTADLVVRVRSLGGRIAIIDNKTVASSGAWSRTDVDISDQLGLYTRGWNRLYVADPAIYSMHSQVRRDKLKRPMTLSERFSRLHGNRTDAELDEIEADLIDDLERMHSERNLARPTSHPDPKQCGWKCDFKEAHIVLRRSGGDWDAARRVIEARGMVNDPAGDPALQRHH